MKRYNAKFIFEVGQSVAHLRDCIEGRVQAWSKDRMMPFIFVTFDGAVRAVGLSVSCSRHAERVCAVLNEIGETDGEISDKQWTRLKKSIEEFDTVFRSACEDMDVFLVEDVRG